MNWKDYAPKTTSRLRERTEWSITYTFHSTDLTTPRVLLIGDSICQAYKDYVIAQLEGKVNVSYWASSKCVTDPDYFRELELILDGYHYDIISFNNGLHSLVSDRTEWDAAYASAISFIRAKLPEAKLCLTLSTPLKDAAMTAICASLNETVIRLAKEQDLDVIDLFSAMAVLDRDTYWADTYHFSPEAIIMQAEILSRYVLDHL